MPRVDANVTAPLLEAPVTSSRRVRDCHSNGLGLEKIAKALKPVCTAPTENAASTRFLEFSELPVGAGGEVEVSGTAGATSTILAPMSITPGHRTRSDGKAALSAG